MIPRPPAGPSLRSAPILKNLDRKISCDIIHGMKKARKAATPAARWPGKPRQPRKRAPLPEPERALPVAIVSKSARTLTFPDDATFLKSLQVLEKRLALEFFSE